MPYVYSTATCGGEYVEYKKPREGESHNIPLRKVTINGGHGVATKHLVTPKGVATKVTHDELEFLLKDPNFKRHVDAGFMSYENSKLVDPEKKVADMAKGDNSAPLIPEDFKEGEHSGPESRIYRGRPKK